MLDFDAGKLIVFGIIALAVIPPKDLPRVLRTIGKYVGQMRRMASDFQGQFMEAMKEAELESVKKEIDEITSAAKVDTSFEPAKLMRDQMEAAVEDRPAPAVHEADTAAPPAPEVYEAVTVAPPPPEVYEAVTVAPPAPAETTAEKAASNAT
jgi:sec-independent protein translocase protein TatB